MRTRAYLRLLRPVHATLWTAFMAFTWSRFSIVVHHGPEVGRWIGFGVIAPLFAGLCVSIAANTAMCRPFFLLLPHGTSRLRRPTMVTLAIVALVLAALAIRFTDAPVVGAVGGVLTLLAFGFAVPPVSAWAFASGFPLLAAILIGQRLRASVITYPWAWFIVGAVAVVVALRLRFSPARRREQAFLPFNSAGLGFFALLNMSATRRFAQERLRQVAQRRGESPLKGRAWVPADVPRRTWDWMRVFWHSQGGRLPYPWSHVVLAVFFGVEIAGLGCLGFLFGSMSHAAFGVKDFLWILAHAGAIDPFGGNTHEMVGLVGVVVATEALLITAFSMFLGYPRTIYPISRRALAQASFGVGLVQIGVAVASMFTVTWLMTLVGQLISGNTLPGWGAYGHLVLLLGLMPFLPLATLTRATQRSWVRLVLAIVVGLATVLGAVLRGYWAPYVLTPLGIVAVLAVTAASTALMYLGYQRYYRRCDLLAELRLLNAIVPASVHC